jgi:hypothetical protein
LQSLKISQSCTMDECVISFFMFSSLVSKFSSIIQLQLVLKGWSNILHCDGWNHKVYITHVSWATA